MGRWLVSCLIPLVVPQLGGVVRDTYMREIDNERIERRRSISQNKRDEDGERRPILASVARAILAPPGGYMSEPFFSLYCRTDDSSVIRPISYIELILSSLTQSLREDT
ncbi:hypothetical protein F4677DRAFT_427009 [Hypoxylon crocopeplum]|nr:hypothetical protein F4677DRAFT_427009 [Hypoxylon crocopeplum]